MHALVRGRLQTSDALEAFYRFKLRTGVLLDRFHRAEHWKKAFYDHIVRCDGDWQSQRAASQRGHKGIPRLREIERHRKAY